MLTKISVLCVLLATAVPVLADDSMSRAAPTDHEMMQDCLRKQKAADVHMSKSQMKRLCKDELKRNKATGAMPTPPTDAPHEPTPPPTP